MKFKFALILSAILFFSFNSSVFAATDVTGEAYGEVFGILSMDISNPGVTIEDINTGDNCSNNDQVCYLEGFSWSDVIGWSVWDGALIEGDAEVLTFPDEYYAKASYNGKLGGFIWGDTTGWIQLSDCASIDAQVACDTKSYCEWGGSYCDISPNGELPDVPSQTDVDWGVYIDFCPLKTDQPTCESIQSNPYCNWDAADSTCVFDNVNNPDGHPFRGFAWSERLGWIKFGAEAGDTGFNGVFTNWYPDLTPPVIDGLLGNAWIPNNSPIGNITWTDFATENDSQVDMAASFIDFTLNANPDFSGCTASGSAVITQNGSDIKLDFPSIGIIGTQPVRNFCQYELNGVLYNGSGFGYFFGSNAETTASNAGVDINNPAPNIIDTTLSQLFTLAGDFNAGTSDLSFNGPAVADGSEIMASFAPADVGGNPIVTISYKLDGSLSALTADSVRNVYLAYNFDASDFKFDQINDLNNINLPAPLEVDILKAVYPFPYNNISFPLAGPAILDYSYNGLGTYELPIYTYAPTTGTPGNLTMDSIELNTNQGGDGLTELPEVSPSMPAVPLITTGTINSGSALPGSPLPHSYALDPMLEVSDGTLSDSFVTLGLPASATYELINNGSTLLDDFAIDQVLTFTNISGNIGEEVLEIRDINLDSLNDTTGRTDPYNNYTRYQLLKDTEGLADLKNNEFHSSGGQYHDPSYSFLFDPVDILGEYNVSGNYYVEPDDPCIGAGNCAEVTIDRSDNIGFSLTAGGGTKSYTFSLTASQYIPVAIDAQVEFGISQYLAYNPDSSPFSQFAIYPAASWIDGIEVKSIGLGTSGVVSGEQVFETVGGRDLENITTTSSADLRKEIRRNVAQLIRNIDLDKCKTPDLVISSLSVTDSDCVIADPLNASVIQVYAGNSLTLDNNGSTVKVPIRTKYSIILTEGANLYIKDNLSYGGDTKNSLGIIAIADSNGEGANVFLDPVPTNVVGLLYAEGSLLSSPDGGTSFYYGGGANVSDLKNQLFWQGSIASKNTIGGAANTVIPDGVDCTPWPDDESCAQAFDLDFTRRFATLNKDGNEYSLPAYKFSGSGSCPGNYPLPSCSVGLLPTTVKLSGNFIDPVNSKSLNTFFIERDNRQVPPGFSGSGGLSSSQEIR